MARADRTFGRLLARWRATRGKTQLDLSGDADVSQRHLSFVESGRARPSRELVHALANALAIPFRERNALFVAAGFAPIYGNAQLDSAELAHVRRAIDHILEHQEPYPAVVMNRQWDVVARNRAAHRFFTHLLDGERPAPNILRLMFDPDGLRPHVENWDEVAEALIQRVHREAVGGVLDEATQRLLAEVLAYDGVPGEWRTPDLTRTLVPLIAIAFRKGDLAARFFSAVTTLGTPQDVTLQELRIEAFFPADTETAARFG